VPTINQQKPRVSCLSINATGHFFFTRCIQVCTYFSRPTGIMANNQLISKSNNIRIDPRVKYQHIHVQEEITHR